MNADWIPALIMAIQSAVAVDLSVGGYQCVDLSGCG